MKDIILISNRESGRMKKVFLIGADGMLGGELKERLEKKYEVVGTTIETLDICDKEAGVKGT